MPAAPAFPPAPDKTPVKRALISVSDKTGLIETARALHDLGVELISTGGTKAAIAGAIVVILIDGALRLWRGKPFTRLYLVVSALTLAVGRFLGHRRARGGAPGRGLDHVGLLPTGQDDRAVLVARLRDAGDHQHVGLVAGHALRSRRRPRRRSGAPPTSGDRARR